VGGDRKDKPAELSNESSKGKICNEVVMRTFWGASCFEARKKKKTNVPKGEGISSDLADSELQVQGC